MKNYLSFFKLLCIVCSLSLTFLLGFRNRTFAQSPIQADFIWVGSTDNTADFDVILTNTGNDVLKFIKIVLRGTHNANIATPGATISWNALNNNTLPDWNNWPSITTDLGYDPNQNLLSYSSNANFDCITAPVIPFSGNGGVNIGRFRVKVTNGTWLSNAQFGFTWASTANISATPDSICSYNIYNIGINGTVSASQPLNGNTQLSIHENLETSPCLSADNFNFLPPYPNPANQQLCFDVCSQMDQTEMMVQVIDMQGRIIKVEKVVLNEGVNELRFDAADLTEGLYQIGFFVDGILVKTSKVKKSN